MFHSRSFLSFHILHIIMTKRSLELASSVRLKSKTPSNFLSKLHSFQSAKSFGHEGLTYKRHLQDVMHIIMIYHFIDNFRIPLISSFHKIINNKVQKVSCIGIEVSLRLSFFLNHGSDHIFTFEPLPKVHL